MASREINWPETVAAFAVGAAGLFMVVNGSELSFGSLRRMGPGFMPVTLGVTLMLFSVGLLTETAFSAREPFKLRARPILSVSAAMLFFAVAVRTAGLVPATVGTVVLAALADAPFRPLRAVISGLIISAGGYLVFKVGLGLSLDPFWW